LKLAFVTSLAPTAKPDTGFEIANAAIVGGLRRAGHEVAVIGFARPLDELPPDPDRALLGRIVIENAAAGRARKLAWLGSALIRGLPFAAAKLWLAGLGSVVAAVRAKGPFDAVILNSVMMPAAFPGLLGLAPTLLVAHNIEHRSAAENAAHAPGAAMRWLYGREARLLKSVEHRLAASCGFLWCLAEEDRQALAELAEADVADRSAVLPLVSGEALAPCPAHEPPRFDAGMIGTWTWEPNLIGLRWFLDEVAPRLPAGFRVAVAGRLPQGLSAPPNVELVGRVDSATGFLRGCGVVALASRAGTGVQLKTIEALQLGLPAVATRHSLRGVADIPPNVAMADDAPGFAAALVEQAEAARHGTARRLDGGAFMRAQAAALDAALGAGLAHVRARR
jgi:hypothetical protein